MTPILVSLSLKVQSIVPEDDQVASLGIVTGKGKDHMTKINKPENLFEGFQAPSEAEVRERWPQEWEQSRQAVEAMTSEDMESWQREVTAQMIRMAEFMVACTPARCDDRVRRCPAELTTP
ncbi:TipAS antibiotic-recognition domain-containing protein [Streptomyces spiralis]